jgi:hypothetical protein
MSTDNSNSKKQTCSRRTRKAKHGGYACNLLRRWRRRIERLRLTWAKVARPSLKNKIKKK